MCLGKVDRAALKGVQKLHFLNEGKDNTNKLMLAYSEVKSLPKMWH